MCKKIFRLRSKTTGQISYKYTTNDKETKDDNNDYKLGNMKEDFSFNTFVGRVIQIFLVI